MRLIAENRISLANQPKTSFMGFFGPAGAGPWQNCKHVHHEAQRGTSIIYVAWPPSVGNNIFHQISTLYALRPKPAIGSPATRFFSARLSGR